MARHSQMIVAIMKQINYNHGADLSRGTHLGILECLAKGPSSMGAQFQLGKSPFIPESRQAENPCMSVHNFWGFFTSAVLQTTQRTIKAVAWNKSLKYL